MSYDEIMRSITSGLTGDGETDKKYLHEQMEKYKNHELATEIIRACGRLMFDCLTESQKKELQKSLANDQKGIQSALDELKFLMYKRDFTRAEELSASLVEKANAFPMYKNDSKSDYYTFQEPFEEILFRQYDESGKDVRRADFPFSDIYFFHGNLMVELKKYAEAKTSLALALRWNPASCSIAFEYGEALKMSGDLEGYLQLTRDCFRYAYKPSDIARCYRNLGFYFVETKQYDEAIACYQLSMYYGNSQAAQSELYYIQGLTGTPVHPLSMEEIEKTAKTGDFPHEPNRNILAIAYAYGQHFLKNDNLNGAIYCFSIFADITHDQKTIDLINNLKQDSNT